MEKNELRSAVLFVNNQKKYAVGLADQICCELKKHGIQGYIFSFEGKPELVPSTEVTGFLPSSLPEKNYDIAFSLGGDGTVLYTARCLAPFGIPILPVNLGTFGFIAEVKKDDWLDVFSRWNKNEIVPSRRCMFEISVERDSKIIMKNICLNDAVISAAGIAKLIKLDVYINSIFCTKDENVTLGSYQCDGLIISTPTGSTAYSMAAGGPILDPEMEALILNPICPFPLSNRPIVLPSRQLLEISLTKAQRSGALLTVDGQDTFNLEFADKILIKQTDYPAYLIFADKQGYYSALRNKLFWSGGTDA
ncbi:MAG: NAD(+)/NADH kinase [Treponema sp.]|nr:NAD(+)/NADH kinase [Treponema sp.]